MMPTRRAKIITIPHSRTQSAALSLRGGAQGSGKILYTVAIWPDHIRTQAEAIRLIERYAEANDLEIVT